MSLYVVAMFAGIWIAEFTGPNAMAECLKIPDVQCTVLEVIVAEEPKP